MPLDARNKVERRDTHIKSIYVSMTRNHAKVFKIVYDLPKVVQDQFINIFRSMHIYLSGPQRNDMHTSRDRMPLIYFAIEHTLLGPSSLKTIVLKVRGDK